MLLVCCTQLSSAAVCRCRRRRAEDGLSCVRVPLTGTCLQTRGSAADPELAELARQVGMPADKLTSVLEQLLPSSAPAAVTPEKLLTAFVMKR